jgi:membrane protease subunit HflK
MTQIDPNAPVLPANPWGDDDRPSDTSSGGGQWSRKPKGGGGWGGGGDDGPPEFDQFFRRSRDNFNRMMPGGRNNFMIVAGVIAVLWLISGIYSVGSGERGVIMRFGEFNRLSDPGLHMHLPWPIETVLKPNVQQINQVDVGVVTHQRGQDASGTPAGQILTQDKNILNMHFRILWKIQDPQKYLFNLRDPQATIRAAGESVMRELVGQTTFDDIVRGGREKLAQDARDKLQQILDSYQSGILIDNVLPQKIDPPAEVIDAFNDVQRAEQDAEREINLAEAYKSDIVPRAKGEAERIRLDAEAYKGRAVKDAEGESKRFISVYDAYRTAGSVTLTRLYFETMQEVMKNSNKIIVDSKSGAMPYLPIQDLADQAKRARDALKPQSSAQQTTPVIISGSGTTGDKSQ